MGRSLIARGCRLLVVVSKSGRLPEEVQSEWAGQGVRFVTRAADLSDFDAACGLFNWVADAHPGVRLVVHAAGVSNPVPLCDLDSTSFWAGAGAKVAPIRALLASRLVPQTVILLSSTAAVWSQTGGASYAAANAWLDGVAARERAGGRAFTSLQLGPFKGAGMAAAHADQLAALGLGCLHPAQAWIWGRGLDNRGCVPTVPDAGMRL